VAADATTHATAAGLAVEAPGAGAATAPNTATRTTTSAV